MRGMCSSRPADREMSAMSIENGPHERGLECYSVASSILSAHAAIEDGPTVAPVHGAARGRHQARFYINWSPNRFQLSLTGMCRNPRGLNSSQVPIKPKLACAETHEDLAHRRVSAYSPRWGPARGNELIVVVPQCARARHELARGPVTTCLPHVKKCTCG